MKDFYLKLYSCNLLLMKDLYFEIGVSFVFLGIQFNKGQYYLVGVEDVMDGKVPLFVTNEVDDPPQLHLKDIVGTTTLWDHEYLVIADVPQLFIIDHTIWLPHQVVFSYNFLPLYYQVYMFHMDQKPIQLSGKQSTKIIKKVGLDQGGKDPWMQVYGNCFTTKIWGC